MLISWEKHTYNIAYSAAMGIPFDADFNVCSVCHGTGLLPHPTSYMNVAICYVCRNGLVPKQEQEQTQSKKKFTFDSREHCNVSAKTVSA